MKNIITLCGLLTYWLLLGSATFAEDAPTLPGREAVLADLKGTHPRLLATDDDFAKLRSLCETNAQAVNWCDELRNKAEELLQTPPLVYRIPDGKRLLSVSRAAKERVLLLALMYRLTADQRFAERAWQELDTITRFKDWNPSHFLDTAEMTFAVAIGYDWLFDVWNDRQREQLREAIKTMGLEPGLSVYRAGKSWSRRSTTGTRSATEAWGSVRWRSLTKSLSWPPKSLTMPCTRCRSRCTSFVPTAVGARDPAIGDMPPSTTCTSSRPCARRWAPTSDWPRCRAFRSPATSPVTSPGLWD